VHQKTDSVKVNSKDRAAQCADCWTPISRIWRQNAGQECRQILPVYWQVLSPTRKVKSYSDQTLTFASHSKKKKSRKLSVQTGLRGSNEIRVGRKMATIQLFFQSGWAKDLSAPL